MTQLGTELDSLLDQAKTIGHEYLVCAWIDEPDRNIHAMRRVREGSTMSDAAWRLIQQATIVK